MSANGRCDYIWNVLVSSNYMLYHNFWSFAMTDSSTRIASKLSVIVTPVNIMIVCVIGGIVGKLCQS